MENKDMLIPVARISKLFGTGGEVAINLYDTFPADYGMDKPLFASVDGLAVPFYPEKFERRGRSGALVAFADIDTPQRATELLGMELSIGSGAMDEESPDDADEIYFEDLVGFRAVFTDKPYAGTIVGFVDSEYNPLLTLSIDGKEAFIPASDDFIEKFSIRKREITFDLPDGLLELYL